MIEWCMKSNLDPYELASQIHHKLMETQVMRSQLMGSQIMGSQVMDR